MSRPVMLTLHRRAREVRSRRDSGISGRARRVIMFMTRSEIVSAVHSALREKDLSLTLIAIRKLPFAWELHFEDLDGVERLVTLHPGSVANVEAAITDALGV